MRTTIKLVSLTAIALGLSACGGGGGSSGPAGTIQTSGTITVKQINGNVLTSINDVQQAEQINGRTSITLKTQGDARISGSGGTVDMSINGTHTVRANGTFSESTTVSAPGYGSETDYDSGTWSKDGQVVTFDGGVDTKWKIGGTYTNTGTVHLGSESLGYTATADASNLLEMDVVNGQNSNTFFITNVGTGRKDTAYTHNIGVANLTGQTRIDAVAAHNIGWTGKGTDIVKGTDVTAANGTVAAEISPRSRKLTNNNYNRDGFAVGRSTTNWSNENNYFTTDNPVTAGATSLVLHKFSTLYADQAGDIVISTKNSDGTANIGNALSPVGHIN